MAAAAVSCILADGWKGGALPGAIALIGYDQQIVSTCLTICTWSQSQGQSQNHTRMTKVGLTDPVAFEWPPLAIFIEADDPSIAECARACRKLRAANVPIRLEIVDPFSNSPAEDLTDATISEFVSEVDAFFDAHLAADFPKMR
ncbi:hypothetical protein DYH55_17385 [Methylovirgula sp. 4M-Z18]|nr:hypothetical protein DYH55_17385 [Methylovirgula sp. 4M-Z18]